MKRLFLMAGVLVILASCDSAGVTANYDSLKVKKLYLESEEGKTYELKIVKDEEGEDMLGISLVE